ILIKIQQKNKKRLALFTKCRTINAAEIFSIYIAGILTHGKAKIYTDSQTAIKYINKKINYNKPRSREQYLNHLECKYWAYQVRNLKLKQTIEWVKGHSNSAGNIQADKLAMLGRKKSR
ncbi:MAG: hypothetical protein J1F17_04135, partial [Oscillospiraceae bacterium]|nr:hypothetical protein [Oscillospiraceae bacterium]